MNNVSNPTTIDIAFLCFRVMAVGRSNLRSATYTVFLVLFACLLLIKDVPPLQRRRGSFLVFTTTARANSDGVFVLPFFVSAFIVAILDSHDHVARDLCP